VVVSTVGEVRSKEMFCRGRGEWYIYTGVGVATPPTRTQKEEEVGRRQVSTQGTEGRRSRPRTLGLSEAKDDKDEENKEAHTHNLAVLEP